MDPWKWDYSKTFARFLSRVSSLRRPFLAPDPSFHPFCRDSFVLPHNDAPRLWEQRSRIHRGEACQSVFAFCPFFFRRFNCCANICPAGDRSTPRRTQLPSKVRRTLISFSSPIVRGHFRPLTPVNFGTGTNDRLFAVSNSLRFLMHRRRFPFRRFF